VTTPDVPAIDEVVVGPVSHGTSRLRWVLLLGALTSFGPLSLDLYLPAFPVIERDFHTSASRVQLTLTACLVGLALGQLVAGPLSDRFGRRRPLLLGIAAYAIASLLCALAPDINTLTAARLLQGLAGSAGIVIARAVARDLHSGAALARLFALLMLVLGLTPILGPTVGAQVLKLTSWHGIFVVLAGIGVALLVAVFLLLPETLPAERRHAGGIGSTVRTFGRLLKDRAFVGYALTAGFVLGAMFGYIAGSSFVLQETYGMSAQEFSFVFGGNAVGLIAMSQVSARLVQTVRPQTLLRVAVGISATGGTALLISVLAGAGLPAVLASLFLLVLSVGLASPNATALALADHPDVAGSAAALLGLGQYAIGCVLAPLTGLAGETSFAWVIAGSAVTAAVVHTTLVRNAS
jgi:DHA1 family bicyclomycin/chloramphenicol resistance-like MFS transporter